MREVERQQKEVREAKPNYIMKREEEKEDTGGEHLEKTLSHLGSGSFFEGSGELGKRGGDFGEGLLSLM